MHRHFEMREAEGVATPRHLLRASRLRVLINLRHLAVIFAHYPDKAVLVAGLFEVVLCLLGVPGRQSVVVAHPLVFSVGPVVHLLALLNAVVNQVRHASFRVLAPVLDLLPDLFFVLRPAGHWVWIGTELGLVRRPVLSARRPTWPPPRLFLRSLCLCIQRFLKCHRTDHHLFIIAQGPRFVHRQVAILVQATSHKETAPCFFLVFDWGRRHCLWQLTSNCVVPVFVFSAPSLVLRLVPLPALLVLLRNKIQ